MALINVAAGEGPERLQPDVLRLAIFPLNQAAAQSRHMMPAPKHLAETPPRFNIVSHVDLLSLENAGETEIGVKSKKSACRGRTPTRFPDLY